MATVLVPIKVAFSFETDLYWRSLSQAVTLICQHQDPKVLNVQGYVAERDPSEFHHFRHAFDPGPLRPFCSTRKTAFLPDPQDGQRPGGPSTLCGVGKRLVFHCRTTGASTAPCTMSHLEGCAALRAVPHVGTGNKELTWGSSYSRPTCLPHQKFSQSLEVLLVPEFLEVLEVL